MNFENSFQFMTPDKIKHLYLQVISSNNPIVLLSNIPYHYITQSDGHALLLDNPEFKVYSVPHSHPHPGRREGDRVYL